MRAAFSLLELTLALALAIVFLAASIIGFRMHAQSARIARAKTMLAGIRLGIQATKLRTGSYPSLAAAPATASLADDTDDLGYPYWGIDGATASLADPITGQTGIFAPGATTSWGGWIYATGSASFSFAVNLPGAWFPGDPPGNW